MSTLDDGETKRENIHLAVSIYAAEPPEQK